MGVEIERKFLPRSAAWRAAAERSVRMTQGYLANTSRSSVRVRRAGDSAWLSVKSMTHDLVRLEFEYAIPVADAQVMLAELADGPVVSKTRHFVEIDNHVFEIDEFDGANAGLIVAEVELGAADESHPCPPWLGTEVTHDARYMNSNLVRHPYSQWEGR